MKFTIFLLIFKFLIMFLFLNNSFNNCARLNDQYPYSYLLSNKDIFIILSNGIRVYDYTLTTLKTFHDFKPEQKISSEEDAGKSLVAQFGKTGKIFALVKNILFVCSPTGNYLDEVDLNNYLSGNYYSLI